MVTREDGAKVISIANRNLPRNEDGDVKFDSFDELKSCFEPDEIVTLCERALYHMEYQRSHHKKYSAALREKEKPVKAAAKKLFPGTAYINLTTDQYQKCLDMAYPEGR
jgi:hypothetical protein